MSGSRTDRSTNGYSAAIRATSGAADSEAGKASHCRGPSTFTVRTEGADSSRIGGS